MRLGVVAVVALACTGSGCGQAPPPPPVLAAVAGTGAWVLPAHLPRHGDPAVTVDPDEWPVRLSLAWDEARPESGFESARPATCKVFVGQLLAGLDEDGFARAKERIRELRLERPGLRGEIDADPELPFAYVVSGLDALRSEGVRSIEFLSVPENSRPRPYDRAIDDRPGPPPRAPASTTAEESLVKPADLVVIALNHAGLRTLFPPGASTAAGVPILGGRASFIEALAPLAAARRDPAFPRVSSVPARIRADAATPWRFVDRGILACGIAGIWQIELAVAPATAASR